MKKIKLSSGLRVKISSSLSQNKKYREIVRPDMLRYAGKVGVITSNSEVLFMIRGCDQVFSTDMLAPFIDEDMLKHKKAMLG